MDLSRLLILAGVNLTEGRFRKPVVMFHGTSTTNLRSILKLGVVPNPSVRTWGKDPDATFHSASRVSLAGSYWTSNLLTALSSAHNSKRKLGGEQLLVVAQIAEQSALADEDSINTWIDFAYHDAIHQVFPGLSSDAVGSIMISYYEEPTIRDKIHDIFAAKLHKQLSRGGEPLDRQLADDTFRAYLRRKMAHGNKHWDMDYYLRHMSDPPPIPTVEEAEADYLAIRDRLTRRYRGSAYRQSDRFLHSLRILEPVRYRGANRIIGIVEIPDYLKDTEGKFHQPPLILHYGSLPAELHHQWTERIGKWPGLQA